MRVIPKSADTIAKERLAFTPWPKGWYTAVITGADEKRSSKGNDMLELTIKVYNGELERTIWSYLVPGSGMDFLVRHAAEAVGRLAEYEKGEILPEHFRGASVEVELGVEKDKEGKYGDRNKVSDMRAVPPTKAQMDARRANGAKPTPVAGIGHAPIEDEDIPFAPWPDPIWPC